MPSKGLVVCAMALTLMAADRAPVVTVVGCASASDRPNIWRLSRAGERSGAARAGISAAERDRLTNAPLGRDLYELIGVADFVDVDTSRAIGVRGDILPRERVNATGMLKDGRKVAVRGLFIDGSPPRINLTSVVDLGVGCP